MPVIYGALRIKNESRWIERVIRAMQPACDRIFVLDDFSTDATPEICESLGCTVYRSTVPLVGVEGRLVSDESAGKQWLLERLFEAIPADHQHFTKGNPTCPYWCLALDGDEELVQGDAALIRRAVETPDVHAWMLKILYLWDRPDQWRVDGVYGNFRRPSLFRLMNHGFKYQKTPFGNGANFHCSSIPQELLGHARHSCEARLLHWGYIDKELRMRKYEFYNKIDPNSHGEDCYRHVVQGDVPQIPASMKLRWAGPLELRPL